MLARKHVNVSSGPPDILDPQNPVYQKCSFSCVGLVAHLFRVGSPCSAHVLGVSLSAGQGTKDSQRKKLYEESGT